MPAHTIAHYDQHAAHYQTLYDSVKAEDVHAGWVPLLRKQTPGQALDVGAGSGRDANWLAAQGWKVTAVEPAQGLRERGYQTTGHQVNWVDAHLPDLADLEPPASGYDLILLSAVWMHLHTSERPSAFKRLSQLLSKTGILIISLRFGPSDPARPMYPVSTEELTQFASQHGLRIQAVNANTARDQLKRDEVSWKIVCIQHLSDSQG